MTATMNADVEVPIRVYGCGNCGDVRVVDPPNLTWRFLVRNGAALCECSMQLDIGYVARIVTVGSSVPSPPPTG